MPRIEARVGALEDLVELREPDAADDLFLRLREADGAPVILDANLAAAVRAACSLQPFLKPRKSLNRKS